MMYAMRRIREKRGPLEKIRGHYGEIVEGYQVFSHNDKFHFKNGIYNYTHTVCTPHFINQMVTRTQTPFGPILMITSFSH